MSRLSPSWKVCWSVRSAINPSNDRGSSGRRGATRLFVGQTVGDGEKSCVVEEKSCVVEFEELQQALTLSGYRQGHREHVAQFATCMTTRGANGMKSAVASTG